MTCPYMHAVDAGGDTARMKERLTWAMDKLGLGQEERAAWLVWPLHPISAICAPWTLPGALQRCREDCCLQGL
jgi:hypothetical protein